MRAGPSTGSREAWGMPPDRDARAAAIKSWIDIVPKP
jgi:hypothetical protein